MKIQWEKNHQGDYGGKAYPKLMLSMQVKSGDFLPCNGYPPESNQSATCHNKMTKGRVVCAQSQKVAPSHAWLVFWCRNMEAERGVRKGRGPRGME